MSDLPVPGWAEYKLLVLAQLETLKLQQQQQEKDVAALKVDMALLKQKASVYGAVAGLIPSAIAALIWWLSQG